MKVELSTVPPNKAVCRLQAIHLFDRNQFQAGEYLENFEGFDGERQMTRPSDVRKFAANIICPGCSSLGMIVWENDGGRRSLVSLSNGFHERLSRKAPHLIELVCNSCGSVQAEDQG